MNAQKVQVYSGADGIRQAYEAMLGREAIDTICLSSNYEEILGEWFDEDFSLRLYKAAATREIIPDTKENRAFAKTKDASRNAVKFMPSDLASGQTDLVVSDSKLMLVSFNEADPFVVVISDPELVKSAKAQFEALWRRI